VLGRHGASNGAALPAGGLRLLRPSNRHAVYLQLTGHAFTGRPLPSKNRRCAGFREIFAQYVFTVFLRAKRKTLNWDCFQSFKNGNWFEPGLARLLSDSEQRLQA
jgi:hypothetical protein